MGILSDTSEEFKKLPTGGKVAVVGVFLLVIGVGYYEYKKNQASTSGIGPSSPSTSLQPGQSSGLPSFPYGTTTLTDANGNPIGTVQPPPPPVPGPTGNPPPPSPPTGPPNPFQALFHDLSFLGGKPATLGRVININGQTWTIVPGSQGRIWGVPGQVSTQTALNMPIQPGGKQLLFSGSGGGFTGGKAGGGDTGTKAGGGATGSAAAPQKEGGGEMQQYSSTFSKNVVQKYSIAPNGHIYAEKVQVGGKEQK